MANSCATSSPPDPSQPLRSQWSGSIAARLPSHTGTALVAGETTFTYAEIDHWSQAVATWLRAQDVDPEDTVAIHAARGPALPVAMLGVWKAGALPLSPGTSRALFHGNQAVDRADLVGISHQQKYGLVRPGVFAGRRVHLLKRDPFDPLLKRLQLG